MTAITQNGDNLFARIKRQSQLVLVGMILLSAGLHLLSYVNLNYVARRYRMYMPISSRVPVNIRIVDKKQTSEERAQAEREMKKIVETRLQKTEKPKDARYSSFQDHMTDKQTRVETNNIEKAKEAGQKGFNKEIPNTSPQQREALSESKPQDSSKTRIEIGAGSLPMTLQDKRKKERYKQLMPSSKELSGLIDAGYQQHLDEEIDFGDRVDINTSEYRYMGYFTNMRKSIELVWSYPMEAARAGMQGEVAVEFVINKDGNVSRVKVVKSSGYKMLDDAIVEALKLASPFAPLPTGFGKEKMLVTGSFRYILSSFFAGAH